MSSFCDDETQYSDFFGLGQPSGQDEMILHLDWPPNNASVTGCTESPLSTLTGDPAPELRIIFALLDLSDDADGLQPLFQHYAIPRNFVVDQQRHVTQSSGSQEGEGGFNASWCRILCKYINIKWVLDANGDPTDAVTITDDHPANLNPVDQSNFTWLRSAFFLRWDPVHALSGSSSHTQTSVDAAITPSKRVTLICFGTPKDLIKRFEGLLQHSSWRRAVENPFDLLVIVLDEMFKQMDAQVWNLAQAFRRLEHDTLNSANRIGEQERSEHMRFDFVGLHNIAKHCAFLREGFSAILITADDLIAQHSQFFRASSLSPLSSASPFGSEPGQSLHYLATQNMLKHKLNLFKSTNLRIASLEKRIEHAINLSFNLVVQQDSRTLLQDSQRMEAMTTITLFFLPIATVGAMFGSQFFGLDVSSSPPSFHVAREIWVFWLMVILVTIGVACMKRRGWKIRLGRPNGGMRVGVQA